VQNHCKLEGFYIISLKYFFSLLFSFVSIEGYQTISFRFSFRLYETSQLKEKKLSFGFRDRKPRTATYSTVLLPTTLLLRHGAGRLSAGSFLVRRVSGVLRLAILEQSDWLIGGMPEPARRRSILSAAFERGRPGTP
jgi:hypothetical protein